MRNLHCTKWAPVPIVTVVANGAPHRSPWPWAPRSPPLFADQDGAARRNRSRESGPATQPAQAGPGEVPSAAAPAFDAVN